jgi:hypothetical protein
MGALMARRKLTVVEQAIKDAAAELKLPKGSWDVERLAKRRLMWKVAFQKWATGQSSKDAADMLTLMAAITQLLKDHGIGDNRPTELKVSFVEKLRGRCCACGHMNELDEDAVREVIRIDSLTLGAAQPKAKCDQKSDHRVSEKPGDVATLADAGIDKPAVTYREGVSASPFHSQVVNGVVPPLKRDQPGVYDMLPHVTSPMSYSVGNGPEPRRRRDAPGGSAFDDPNPNRKLS